MSKALSVDELSRLTLRAIAGLMARFARGYVVKLEDILPEVLIERNLRVIETLAHATTIHPGDGALSSFAAADATGAMSRLSDPELKRAAMSLSDIASLASKICIALTSERLQSSLYERVVRQSHRVLLRAERDREPELLACVRADYEYALQNGGIRKDDVIGQTIAWK
jgi:hypothetical protein